MNADEPAHLPRSRTVTVRIATLGIQHGLWCRTCALLTGRMLVGHDLHRRHPALHLPVRRMQRPRRGARLASAVAMTRRAILAANLIGWPLFVLDQIILRRNNRKPR